MISGVLIAPSIAKQPSPEMSNYAFKIKDMHVFFFILNRERVKNVNQHILTVFKAINNKKLTRCNNIIEK